MVCRWSASPFYLLFLKKTVITSSPSSMERSKASLPDSASAEPAVSSTCESGFGSVFPTSASQWSSQWFLTCWWNPWRYPALRWHPHCRYWYSSFTMSLLSGCSVLVVLTFQTNNTLCNLLLSNGGWVVRLSFKFARNNCLIWQFHSKYVHVELMNMWQTNQIWIIPGSEGEGEHETNSTLTLHDQRLWFRVIGFWWLSLNICFMLVCVDRPLHSTNR